MPLTLSVAIITRNEEANLARTLASVAWADEVVIVDNGSTDQTEAIAREFGARFFVEDWKGFGAQKNSAMAKCTGDWVLALDADEEVSPELAADIRRQCIDVEDFRFRQHSGFTMARRNYFLGRWIRHGGYYPDRKLRLVLAQQARFEDRAVHETMQQPALESASFQPTVGRLRGDLIHHAYPTLDTYIEHMNRYSALGADQALAKGKSSRGLIAFLWNVYLTPVATFLYNYLLRGGFLDGREGLLLHLYHSAYVSWKYAKAWERGRSSP
jgi:glycosyltransferase involved in cell wall biosynthesis